MARTIATTLALLRHLRAEWRPALLLVSVIGLTAFVLAAIPQFYNGMLDAEIQHEVDGASDSWRNIAVATTGRLELAGDDALLAALDRGGTNYRADLSPAVREFVTGQSAYAESPEYELWPTPGQSWAESDIAPAVRGLRLRFQTGLEERITLASGRLPLERPPPTIRWSEWKTRPGARGEPAYSRYEILLPSGAGGMLGLEVGDFARLRIPFERILVYVQVAGFYSVNDTSASYWNDDTRLHAPRIVGFAEDFRESESVRGFGEASSTTAIAAASVYSDFLRITGAAAGDGLTVSPPMFDFLQRTAGQAWRYGWIFYTDTSILNGGTFEPFARELAALKITGGPVERLVELDAGPLDPDAAQIPNQLPSQAQPQTRPSTFALSGVTVQNELGTAFEQVAVRARLASSAVALATVGVLAVSLAAVALLCALIADRRRELVTLLRSRGASRGQLLLAQFAEGALLVIPATIAGATLALVFVDGRASPLSLVAAGAVAVLGVVLLLVAARVNILAGLGELPASRDRTAEPAGSRRFVAEACVVLLALAGIVLLRQRGLGPETGGGGLTSVDPFLAAVPALLALAAGIASLRLYPLLAGAVAWLAGRMRGAVLFVGLRRITGQSFAARLPLLVVLLAVGVSSSSAIIVTSVDRAQDEFAWREVRADFRLDARLGGAIPALSALDLTTVPGVETQAREFRSGNALLPRFANSSGFNAPSVTVVVVEAEAFQRITAGTVVDADFLAALAPERSGAAGALPAIVSTHWPEAAGEAPKLGAEIRVAAAAPQFDRPIEFTAAVVEKRAEIPGVSEGVPFVILDWAAFAGAVDRQHLRPLRPTTIYLGGSGIERAAVEAAVPEQAIPASFAALGQTETTGVDVLSRTEIVRALRDAPLAGGLTDISRLTVALAALYAGLAIALAMALAGRERARFLAYLRTLGLSRRQTVLVVLVETAPSVVIASVLGTLFGVASAFLVEPGLDLRAFAGPDAPVGMVAEPSAVVPSVAGILAGMLLLVFAASLHSRRVDPNLVLRVGE